VALSPARRLTVEEPSQVAAARRAAQALAARLAFPETRCAEVAIVATELATNLVRHAGGGELILRPHNASGAGIDVIAWDQGPGMRDVALSLRDGYSTGGGSGTGLGAVQRLASAFEVHTDPGLGSVVLARMSAAAGATSTRHVDGLALAVDPEPVSGDAWARVEAGSKVTILVVDGLGHGVEAARAAACAVRELHPAESPEDLLERMHAALRPTRGAAAAVAELDLSNGALRFAGIGNVAAVAVDGQNRRESLTSLNGTLGHRVQRIRGYDHTLSEDAILVIHTDGCRANWDLADHPGLARRDPLVIASLLIRDHERGRDDVTAVVAKMAAPEP